MKITEKQRLVLISVFIVLVIAAGLLIRYRDFQKAASKSRTYIAENKVEISEIQELLQQRDYLKGEVTDKYDYRTYTAVKEFQKDENLAANGVVEKRTLQALDVISPVKPPASNKAAQKKAHQNQGEIHLLARAVHGEARGEPYIGKVAIAAVVLNRVKSPSFPNSIAGVIYQPGAFTAVADGQINLAPDEESLRAARDAMSGWDPSSGAIYYYNPEKTTNQWIWSRPVHTVIGQHRFAK